MPVKIVQNYGALAVEAARMAETLRDHEDILQLPARARSYAFTAAHLARRQTQEETQALPARENRFYYEKESCAVYVVTRCRGLWAATALKGRLTTWTGWHRTVTDATEGLEPCLPGTKITITV